jgi:endogenous inhibitor of DNA gyrase (YacG/DUF329 family)
MASTRCPVCGKAVDPAASRVMPFCSSRCQQIDLRRWLGEEYGLPLERAEEESDESASPD